MRLILILIFTFFANPIFSQKKLKVEMPRDSFYLTKKQNSIYYLLYHNREFKLYHKDINSNKVQLALDTNVKIEKENGVVQSVKYLASGKVDGFEYRFFKKNKLAYMGFYSNGVMQGKEYYFMHNGNVMQENNYLDGWLHGSVRNYSFGRGRLLSVTEYVNGEKEGEKSSYFRFGKISYVTVYDNGEAVVRRVYNRLGRVIRYVYYKDKKIIKIEKVEK